MSEYKVIEPFVDLLDNNHKYNVGDTFPHDGTSASEKRINDLSSGNNRRKIPLIKKVVESKVEAKPEIKEEVEFMNPPIESDDPVVEEEEKPTRRRRTQK